MGKPKSADSESLRKVQQSDIIGDSAYDGYDSRVELSFSLRDGSAIAGKVLDDSGERNGIAIKSRLVKSLVDNLIELGVGPALQERVKLHVCFLTLMRDLRYELVDLVVLKPLLAILPPLMRSIPICDNYYLQINI